MRADNEEMMLAAAAMKLLPSFWQRLLSETALPSSPEWLVPLAYGTLTMDSVLEVSHRPNGDPCIAEQRFQLSYPAVPAMSDANNRANLPATLVQGVPPCEELIPSSSRYSTIGQHIEYHREQLAREVNVPHSPAEERKVLLAACLSELRQEVEYREAIQLSLQALESLHDPADFAPLGIGSEALRILFDFAMTAGDDEAVLQGLRVWDTIQNAPSSGRSSSSSSSFSYSCSSSSSSLVPPWLRPSDRYHTSNTRACKGASACMLCFCTLSINPLPPSPFPLLS